MAVRTFNAKTIHIREIDLVEVDLSLGFGISVRREINVEGVNPNMVPRKDFEAANRCMIILLGGKNLIVQADDSSSDRVVMGRVFLDEDVYGATDSLLTPFGTNKKRLEVGNFFSEMVKHRFEAPFVRQILNGTSKSDTVSNR